jgi:hypothetical protein
MGADAVTGRDPGRSFQQRSVEELVKAETGLGNQRGRGHEPPRRPRTWLGAAGLLGLLLAAILLVLISDCGGSGPSTEASPSPGELAYSPTGSTDQPPSTVMVWPVTARASGESR